MNYKKTLKKRIKAIQPDLVIEKINLYGDSFKVIIKNKNLNMRVLEQQLREELSMPGLLLLESGK